MDESASFETITPKVAQEWLRKHEDQIANKEILQRTLSEGTVDRYANDMRHGHWIANNQGIGFDENNNFVDGRHRLWAIIRAGVPVRMLVVRGMKEYTGNGVVIKPVHTVDGGRARSLGVQLHLDGMKYASQLSATLRALALLCTRRDQVRLSVPAAKALLRIYEKHIFRIFEGLRHYTTMTKGYLVGPVAMFRTADADKADEFIESYYSGTDLPEGSPILALKSYYRTHRPNGTDGTIRAARATALALMHFNNKVKVGQIRNSTLGSEWLTDLQKANTAKIKKILGDAGTDEVEGEATK